MIEIIQTLKFKSLPLLRILIIYILYNPIYISFLLALYSAMREGRVSNVGLAERLGVTETVVRRLVNLQHRSHIGQVEKALKVLGRKLEVRVKAA